MTKPNNTNRTAARKPQTSLTETIDPIPAMYREYCRVSYKTGNHIGGSTLESRENEALYRSIISHILSTPASSLEGAARQLQMLGTLIDSSGGDSENIAVDSRLLGELWIAIYGALNYMLPLVPQIPDDPEYSLASIETCPNQALGLFRKLLQEAGR